MAIPGERLETQLGIAHIPEPKLATDFNSTVKLESWMTGYLTGWLLCWLAGWLASH
jgi:hypothetical protein